MTNLPYTPKEEEVEDLLIEFLEVGYSLNLTKNNILDLTVGELEMIKRQVTRISFVDIYEEFKDFKTRTFPKLRKFIEENGWDHPTLMEKLVMDFFHDTNVFTMLNPTWFVSKFKNYIDKYLANLMMDTKDLRGSNKTPFSIEEVGTSSAVPRQEKEMDVVEQDDEKNEEVEKEDEKEEVEK